eukprot:260522-Hanusia_phi.AAC.7
MESVRRRRFALIPSTRRQSLAITVSLENNEAAQELWNGHKTIQLDHEDTVLKAAWPEDNESVKSTAAYMKPCKGEECQAMEINRMLCGMVGFTQAWQVGKKKMHARNSVTPVSKRLRLDFQYKASWSLYCET